MNLSGTYVVKADQKMVWHTLLDPDALQHCLPGCQELVVQGPDQYQATLHIGIAAMKGTYTGKVQITERQELTRYKLLVEGTGSGGRVRGEGLLELAPAGPEGTKISYRGDAQVFGPIAAVGQRLLSGAARLLIGQFFKCLERQLGGGSGAESEA
ncbi:MAG: carbon monoxide dehydrogenase subunit G [Deinococcus sp.]|nr:carbon monoxide dehydrogenase subunit G [Deinococcus sp.]